ncbi:GIY-YIG nuclease family protein [Bifidobacterium pseudolongum]|uniref:GIY-YIG nuclease family protein n=1 Tax=Bifidobacterium pseudolongum TaxID=1694 RepID=UPI00101EA645|nr:GIY-YIG nuclease family protein [Bifidobacterium pseudolongum]RYQ00857.1 hypothetical protein PG22511B_0940 [Bifidobacterium pseudolongum subsp. globosum]RYQ57489.1 hypothetical protein PG1616B_0917 [Bifidobacterium pseudolongum subsp. globosum]
MAQHSKPSIKFFNMLGISEQELGEYTIRLNGSDPQWFDVLSEYYRSEKTLMRWIFVKKYPYSKKALPKMQSKVLQFIQLDRREKTPRHWLFLGGYSITGSHMDEESGNEIYDYEVDPRFEPYIARTIVDFVRERGNDQGFIFNMRSSGERRQRFWSHMTVEKIAQSPVSAMPFPGYAHVRLSFDELVVAVHNAEWRGALGAVSAVYLQTDTRTGWHYVGSAYSHHGGSQGLLSRWEEYAGGDHTGGNALLKRLVAEHGADYIKDHFQYSILDIFDPRVPDRVVIEREHWWMDTLSSVRHAGTDDPHGYNSPAQWKKTADGEDAGTD